MVLAEVDRQPGLRRGPGGRRGQLPQLREPRAPRRSCGSSPRPSTAWPRRVWPSGSRSSGATSASTTRARGPTSTRPRSSACSVSSTCLAARPPASAGRPATPWCCLGRPGRDGRRGGPHPLAGSRWAVECAGTATGAARRSTWRPTARLVELVAGLVAETVAGGAGLLAASTTCRAAVWRWPWPRWRWPLGRGLPGAPGSGVTPSCSASCPRGSWCATRRPGAVIARAAQAGVPADGARRGRRGPAGRGRARRPAPVDGAWRVAATRGAAGRRLGEAG